jgi:hypothetical protein
MLVSRLFRNSDALQQCAVLDQAHLTPGSSGDAVALVQRALVVIEQADISETEISAKYYGDTTAREVLKYKTKRKIINPSYQTTPDNIVGKMTIASLDQDMVRREVAGVMANSQKDAAIL